jgi:CRISPR type I-E-associated protein CasB/Cse2
MDKMTTFVLNRRTDPTFRSEVGRGRSPSTEVYAYRHLAFAWAAYEGPARDSVRRSTLLWAAECCDHPRTPQIDDRPLGEMAARLVIADALARDGMETRLLAVQRQDLVVADRTLRTLFASTERLGLGIDWAQVKRLYDRWDHSDLTVRRKVRQRILEDFYAHLLKPRADHDAEPSGRTA